MDSYADFVLRHASAIGSIESLAETATYVLPGRFAHSEIVAEGLHALVSVLGAFHDSVLSGPLAARRAQGPSRHNVYIGRMFRSGAFKTAAHLLALCEYLQVFLEMLAKDYVGETLRWRVIAKIEAVKFICRLLMLRKSNNRLLLASPVPERDYDMSSIKPAFLAEDDNIPAPLGKHSHRKVPALAEIGANDVHHIKDADITAFLNKKALAGSEAVLPEDLVMSLKGPGLVAEWMHMLRPVVYLLALRRYGTKSWTPWILSLTLETTSLGIHANATAIHNLLVSAGAIASPLEKPVLRKTLEKEELRRRIGMLVYCLLRDPFYSGLVKERLHKFCDALSKKPIISLASGLLADYIPLWENYYFLVNP
ncbi:Peroxisomal membrane protein pex16 [Podochytrium sp. JEL0797]|nr:Peroxisomal membrane protein pex16 [Podochytrium sp. JEL0797]